jgi:hypothetical protein
MSVATAARLVVGSACVVVPARVLAVLRAPDRDDVRVQRITRLLGVRLVLQAGLAHVWGVGARRAWTSSSSSPTRPACWAPR